MAFFMNTLIQTKIIESKAKTTTPAWRLLLLGILAGMFIAFGASSSSLAIHAMENSGLAKVVAGTIFPVGLMMIVLIGGELFTGDCMMALGVMHKEFRVLPMIKVLCLVYAGNLIGSAIIATLIFFSGQLDMTNGLLGAFTIKIALGKVSLSFPSAMVSGILCNILVCIAVLMAGVAKDIPGKILAIFFPIMAFVIGGYEHCVANMYYIPAGILATTNDMYRETAMSAYGYTEAQLSSLNLQSFVTASLVPVTIGNIIGGMLFVSVPLYVLHRNSLRNA
ncbi:MAG: formate/nitrite transporter family protein [Lachnospiraceae bacterium]|nr:formate/nitrite transporter family protein [Lachnospiraceae bacterium]